MKGRARRKIAQRTRPIISRGNVSVENVKMMEMPRTRSARELGAMQEALSPIGRENIAVVSQDVLRSIYRQFSATQPLEPGDPRYVECDAARGSTFLPEISAQTIRSNEGPTCQLVAGQSGCGKTTELFRLRHRLETQEARFHVAYCPCAECVDLNDVDFIDVLMAAVQQLATDGDRIGIRLKLASLNRVLKDVKDDLIDIPATIAFTEGINFASLDVRRNSRARYVLRQHLRPRAGLFLEAINEMLSAFQIDLQEQTGARGLVIIFDNLDRAHREQIRGTNRTTLDGLFVDGGAFLGRLACHTIYTIPTTLLHSPWADALSDLYRTTPKVIPMVPVATRSGKDDLAGLQALTEAISRRLRTAGSSIADACDRGSSIGELCKASGGRFLSLMAVARMTIAFGGEIPITSAAIENAVREGRDGLIRAVHSPRLWHRLREIAETKTIGTTEDELELLDNLFVLEYQDESGPWYNVNPLLRETMSMQT
jgi:GTPase SAR1 family protein